MKTTLLCLLSLVLAINCQAQITLTNSNVLLGPYRTDGLFTDNRLPITIPTPARGVNQTWNYANQFMAGGWSKNFFNSTNPKFPGTVMGHLVGELIPGKIFSYSPYYKNNSSELSILGYEIRDQGYSLTSITGHPADSIKLFGHDHTFTSPEVQLSYPVAFNSTWQSNYKQTLFFKVIMVNAGILNEQVNRKSQVTVTDSVVGWGNLIIPGTIMPAANPYPVLMVKRTETAIDSFTMNGNLAPAAMLTTLGLSQGQTRTNNIYRFYRENAMLPLAEFFFGSNNFTTPVALVVDYTNYLTTGLKSELHNHLSVNLYPNPSHGSEITIAFNKPEGGTWNLRLIDITGRECGKYEIDSGGEIRKSIKLTTGLKPGLYTWQLIDNSGKIRKNGKLSITK